MRDMFGGPGLDALRVELQHLTVARDQHGDHDALQALRHVVGYPYGIGSGQLGEHAKHQDYAQNDGQLQQEEIFIRSKCSKAKV